MESLHPVVAAWQHIPALFSPVAFSIGGYPVYWYALFFLGGAALVYQFAGKEYRRLQMFSQKEYQDFAFWLFVSIVGGAKLGFLVLYWWPFVSGENFWMPLVPGRSGFALPGMSFFGGAVGAVAFLWWYSKKVKKQFLALTDVLVLYVPLAIFCGRLGNFFHHELLGTSTKNPWGMYSGGEQFLRHPSALYAAFLEGTILFIFVFFIRKRVSFLGTGRMTAYFCIGYGILRFVSEIFRVPDEQIGYIGIFTLNQYFSLALALGGSIFITIKNRKNTV